jgi:methylase of polypeptide subunit release factors
MLRPGGSLLLEIGQGMESEVVRLLEEAGLRIDRVIPDLQGIPRTIAAERE